MRSVHWADVSESSVPVRRCLTAWQQYWQQSRRSKTNPIRISRLAACLFSVIRFERGRLLSIPWRWLADAVAVNPCSQARASSLHIHAGARGPLRIILPSSGIAVRVLPDLSRGLTGPMTAARPAPYPWTGAMRDHIAVGDRVLLDVSLRAARARLGILAGDGVLLQASEAAYGEGITGMVEVAGSAAGLSRLAGVCVEDVATTDDCARIALRWEAIAADGKLFAALTADLMLTPAGEQITVLALAGAYRRQPGLAGAELDREIVRRCAEATIRSFMARMACALIHPAGAAGPAGGSPPRRPPGEEKP